MGDEKSGNQDSSAGAGSLEKAAKTISVLEKLFASAVALAGTAVAVLTWASTFLATQSLFVLRLSAFGVFGVGVAATVVSIARAPKTPWKWVLAIALLGVFNMCVGIFIWLSIPPKPLWTQLAIPYEMTIPKSPLVQVKDEFIGRGYPGGNAFHELLNGERGSDEDYETKYMVFVSDVFTLNRMPSRIRAINGRQVSLVAYLLEKSSDGSFKEVGRFGFEKPQSELQIIPPKETGANYAMAVVVMPRTKVASHELKGQQEKFYSVE